MTYQFRVPLVSPTSGALSDGALWGVLSSRNCTHNLTKEPRHEPNGRPSLRGKKEQT